MYDDMMKTYEKLKNSKALYQFFDNNKIDNIFDDNNDEEVIEEDEE